MNIMEVLLESLVLLNLILIKFTEINSKTRKLSGQIISDGLTFSFTKRKIANSEIINPFTLLPEFPKNIFVNLKFDKLKNREIIFIEIIIKKKSSRMLIPNFFR